MILMGIFGLVVGFLTSWLSVYTINKLGFSLYNRVGIDIETLHVFGHTDWTHIMVNDLFIVSYSYNEK